MINKHHSLSLSPRLFELAQWIPQGSRFVDVGTDHGYLPLWLLQEGRISSAIATDLNQGPLQHAKSTSLDVGIPLDLRLCDGLQGVSPDEVDTIAVAGMGGITIAQILTQWFSTYGTVFKSSRWNGSFLLQPMSTPEDLRRCLQQLDLVIHREKTVFEGAKNYTLLFASSTTCTHKNLSPYRDIEFKVGRHYPDSPDPNRRLFLDTHLKKITRTLQNLPLHQTERATSLRYEKAELETLLEELVSTPQ